MVDVQIFIGVWCQSMNLVLVGVAVSAALVVVLYLTGIIGKPKKSHGEGGSDRHCTPDICTLDTAYTAPHMHAHSLDV